MQVTLQCLRKVKASLHDRFLFVKTFGQSAPINRENLVKATEVGFDLGWYSPLIVKTEQVEEFYERMRPHWNLTKAEYDVQRAHVIADLMED